MDQVKKRQVKKVLGWITVVAVVALLGAAPLLAEPSAEGDGPKASILSGTVEAGTVEKTLRGGGMLTEEPAEAITIPGGVKLTRFLVSNGDAVAAGDPIAEADPVSVMKAIMQVQEKLDDLARQMEKASDAESDTEVTARAGGRVKLVYAREGDSVRDVMLAHGALAVLSLNGRMAVEFTAEETMYVGDPVTVILPNGTEVEGRVESCLDGTAVVSVEDEDYAVGETVTVTGENGSVLGSGALYIHNAWNAVAWSGTVDEVCEKAGASVDPGDVLFELSGAGDPAQFERLAQQHREYEAVMVTLFRLYEDGIIRSSWDGIVSGVDEDSEYLLDNSEDGDFDPLTENTVASVIPQKTMTVTITVDERDVGKLSLEQTARVQVNALKDQVFDATVTKIGTRGENAGGSSKFTVELIMDRSEGMLAGMNAAVSITWDQAAEGLLVPVAALVENGNETVVYTGFDPETGTLTNPVTVTTGVSDGLWVQILSGLEQGQTFYYAYFDTPALPDQ